MQDTFDTGKSDAAINFLLKNGLIEVSKQYSSSNAYLFTNTGKEFKRQYFDSIE